MSPLVKFPAYAASRAATRDYRTDFLGYAKDKSGFTPVREQREIMEVMTPKDPNNFQIRLLVITGHNIGKTAVVGNAVPWFFDSYPGSRTVTTAPNYKKLVVKRTWAEVHKWGRHINNTSRYRLNTADIVDTENQSHYAIGAAADDPDDFRGLHEPAGIMVVFEEGSGVDDNIYRALEGSQQHNYIFLIITNPGAPTGYVHDIYTGNIPGWTVLNYSAEEAELPDPKWIARMQERYGRDHPFYAMKVLGKFPDIGQDSVYPLSGIERAMGRRGDIEIPNPADADLRAILIDPADTGADWTVFTGAAVKFGESAQSPAWILIDRAHSYNGGDPTFTSGEAIRLSKEWWDGTANYISVDRLGVGAGVYSNLMAHKLANNPPWIVMEYAGSFATTEPATYLNAKAQAHFQAADWFKRNIVVFNPDIPDPVLNKYMGDLLVYKYRYDQQGRYQVTDPRTAKQTRGYDQSEKLSVKSPDYGDTIGQLAWVVRTRQVMPGGKPLPGIKDLVGGRTYSVRDLIGKR